MLFDLETLKKIFLSQIRSTLTYIQKIYVMANASFISESEYRGLFERLFELQKVFYDIGDYEDVIDVATVGGLNPPPR